MLSPQVLTPSERARLTRLENVIRGGIQTFLEIGDALMEIRDLRLYRESHGSFQAYCEGVWQMSRARAYQLIDATGTARTLSSVGIPVGNEREARELKSIAKFVAQIPAAERPATLTLERTGKPPAQTAPKPALPVPPAQTFSGDVTISLRYRNQTWGGAVHYRGGILELKEPEATLDSAILAIQNWLEYRGFAEVLE